MKSTKTLRLSACLAALSVPVLALPGLALAEAGISTGTGTVTGVQARVNLSVVIPRFLIFKVGDFGTTANTVTWTVAPENNGTAVGNNVADESYDGPIPFTTGTTVADDDSTSTATDDGTLDVYAFGNDGDITITTSASNGEFLVGSAPTATIPLSDISVVGLLHPTGGASNGLNLGTSTVPAVNNVAVLDTEWTYDYSASTNPAADTYNTAITYTAIMP